MECDFIPDFSYKAQIGELANTKSQISSFKDFVIISHNNWLNLWDIDTKEIAKRIGIQKKEQISTFCTTEDIFVLGYENGIIRAFNYDNTKVFAFRFGMKKIKSLFYVNGLLYICTVSGRVCSYDMMKNEIIIEYEKQKLTRMPVRNNNTHFVYYTSNKFYIYEFGRPCPVNIYEVKSDILDVCLIGNTLIFLELSGSILFYDIVKKSLFANKLSIKKAKSVYAHGNKLFVLTSKKSVYCYDIDELDDVKVLEGPMKEGEMTETDTNTIKIRNLPPINLKAKTITILTKNIYAITSEGKITVVENFENRKTFLSYHKNEITDIRIKKEFVFTLSEEKLIKWKINSKEDFLDEENKMMELVNTTEFERKTTGMTIFNNLIVLCDSEGLTFLNAETFEKRQHKKMESIFHINSSSNLLVIARNREVSIFDKALEEKHSFMDESEIIFVKLSDDEKLVGVSNFSNKINIYKLPSKELAMSLYGHSLPVRFFDFSTDSKSVISCSADKLIKLWGTEFGECKKTFYINTHCALFMKHNTDLFLAAENDLLYHKKKEIIKKYKNFDIKLFDFNDDFLVAAGKFNVYLYEMDRYELKNESSTESEENLEIENVKMYDKFNAALAKSREENKFDDLFDVMKELDLAEINAIISELDNYSLVVVLKALKENINFSIILSIKIFLSIVQYHVNFITENKQAYEIYRDLLPKVTLLRKTVRSNDKRINRI